MRNPVVNSVLTVFIIVALFFAALYLFFWERFKRIIITETLTTLSSKEYINELIAGAISNPNSIFSKK